MGQVIAVMLTLTTYGTWLRGDARGWVDEGMVFPTDPVLEATDRARLKHPVFLFAPEVRQRVGQCMGESLMARCGLKIHAMTVQSWHTHIVTSAPAVAVSQIAKCSKDAVRWGLRVGRPIWGDGYDKRYCYDVRAALARMAYVDRHNLAAGLPARPWAFITPFV
jgi:hypothetical protein